MKRITAGIFAGALLLLAPLASATAATSPAISLEKCQKATGREGMKYTRCLHKEVSKCLDAVAKGTIRDPALGAESAVRRCVAALRKLENSERPAKTLREKCLARLGKFCDPDYPRSRATHSVDDLIDPYAAHGMQVGALEPYCAAATAQAVALDAPDVWFDHLLATAECETYQQLGMEYPRIVEWLADVRSAIVATDTVATCGDPCADCADVKLRDACSAIDTIVARLDPAGRGVMSLTCGPNYLAATGQTSSFGAGDDGDLRMGRPRAFLDNGDGTLTDIATGLVWEKKDDWDDAPVDCDDESGTCANPHDADNRYTWSAFTWFDGTVQTVMLEQLNNRCKDDVAVPCDEDADCAGIGDEVCGFAGHRDWRLPNRFELESILDMEAVTQPLPFAPFHTGCSATCDPTEVDTCSCTVRQAYWTSTTVAGNACCAYIVDFFDASTGFGHKTYYVSARAVRGGI